MGRRCEQRNMLGFQVYEVKKALASVSNIAKTWNIVQLGGTQEDNIIMNKQTCQNVMLRKKNASL